MPLVLATAASVGCARRARHTDAQCAVELAAIRALRDGRQPCSHSRDCVLWPNEEYWDGCPRELNLTHATQLTALRETYRSHGCSASETGACSTTVRGCVFESCGGY